MKSIVDDTDAIAVRLKDIERASMPEPAPTHKPVSLPVHEMEHSDNPSMLPYDWMDPA